VSLILKKRQKKPVVYIKEDWHEPNLAYDELQEQLDFDRDWYCHEIYEYTMNDLVGK
jgi:hypothetical protein